MKKYIKSFDEVDANAYPDYIVEQAREALGLDKDDESNDYEIDTMSHDEMFELLLEYEGIIGYASMIRGWIEDIYEVTL